MANPKLLTAVVTYPRPGQTDGTETITCHKVTVISDADPVRVLCEFDGEIHNVDSAVFNIDDDGWLSNGTDLSAKITDQAIANHSEVDYPKPIVSWDMIPHQTFTGAFDVDLVAFHRYSYPSSPYGDLDVQVRVTPVNAPSEAVTKASAAGLPR
ncbi:MAG: hypothetical protein ACR2GY_11675 [Phycisphaerales bacterium]